MKPIKHHCRAIRPTKNTIFKQIERHYPDLWYPSLNVIKNRMDGQITARVLDRIEFEIQKPISDIL